eukprot:scaffold7857_cov471-Prasinococcus_capsulatus_cf.AAC.4
MTLGAAASSRAASLPSHCAEKRSSPRTIRGSNWPRSKCRASTYGRRAKNNSACFMRPHAPKCLTVASATTAPMGKLSEELQEFPHLTVPPPPHPSYSLKEIVRQALDEDAGPYGDVTTLSTIPKGTQATATFLAKATGTLAGISLASYILQQVDPTLKVDWTAFDGDRVTKVCVLSEAGNRYHCSVLSAGVLVLQGQKFGRIVGEARSILVAERVALNFMQRMSGIATATREMVDLSGKSVILETRKTVPGLRIVDKWAVVIGGGKNHRIGLYDMVMIKDNHIAAAGGIGLALQRAQEYLTEQNLDIPVEIETRTLEEVEEVLESADMCPQLERIMLDNMTKKESAVRGWTLAGSC